MPIVGLGIDMVSIDRIRGVLARHPGFTSRILTPGEAAYCARGGTWQIASLAGHFAAKEAAAKALGTGIGAVSWQDLEVRHTNAGAPEMQLHGAAASLGNRLGCTHIHLSISHEKEQAVAMVILEAIHVHPHK